MKRRRFRKSTVILLGFTLYSVAVYAYFIPRTDLGYDGLECRDSGSVVVSLPAAGKIGGQTRARCEY